MPAHWWVGLGLVPLEGRAVSRGVFRVAVGSGRLQAACLLMGGAVFLPCWFFGLRRLSTGAYRMLDGARS